MTAVSFPILRLPESALQKSLKLMSMRDQLSLSVLSKNTKTLITAVNEKPISAEVDMTSTSISLRLWSRSFKCFKFVLNHNQSNVEVREYSNNAYESTYLNVPGFTEKQWFEHITQVLVENIFVDTSLNITDSEERSIEEISEYTKELKVGKLQVHYSKIQNYELHKLFPSLNRLFVYSQDPIPKSILTQSVECLHISKMNVTLDDLLVLNHSDFCVTTDSFSDNDMNLFLKHWFKGSNPNLQEFYVFRSNLQQEFNGDIFKGIEGVKIEQGGFTNYQDRREFEIKRHDGTKALVNVEPYFLYFAIIVD